MEENTLIVCYSYSGKTRRIAEMIQKQTGGSLSRIYPRQPYPSDFEKLLIQVKEEIRIGKKSHCFPLTKMRMSMMWSLWGLQTGVELLLRR